MKSTWLAIVGVIALCLGSPAKAFEQIEADLKYPVGMGVSTSGYSPLLGFGASVYFGSLIDPSIPNYISVGYHSFKLRADNSSQLHLVPVLYAIELNGKAFSDFNTTLALGAGFAGAYVGVTGQTNFNFNWSGHFVAQIKPGFEWKLGEGFDLVGHSPVSFYISRALMTSMDFDMGVKFKL